MRIKDKLNSILLTTRKLIKTKKKKKQIILAFKWFLMIS